MNAVTYRRYGPPDVLSLEKLPAPSPKPGELLVRVRAVEATKADCEMRSFRFPVLWFWIPLRLAFGIRRPRNPILGSYFAGEVVETSAPDSRFKPGDPIFGSSQLGLGAYGEYLCLPEKRPLTRIPANCSFAEAASIPLGAFNALHFLRLAKIERGDEVLINGGGGSIGLYAIQIAKNLGATVTVVDKSEKQNTILQAGADRFIDYRKSDFRSEPKRYHVIFDMVVKSPFFKTIRCLHPNGRYLKGNVRFLDFFRTLLTPLLTRKNAFVRFAGETQEELDTLSEMIEGGQIRPIIDRILPLAAASEAHRLVETEQRNGSIVLQHDL